MVANLQQPPGCHRRPPDVAIPRRASHRKDLDRSFDQTFNLINNTGYTLVLDTVDSQNLDGVWPTQVAPHTAAPPVVQNESIDINPIAVYLLQGPIPPTASA